MPKDKHIFAQAVRSALFILSRKRKEMKYLFTSESVTEGHPDKVCDIISDSVVDAVLSKDPKGRVACETMVKNNNVWLMGEITTTADVDYEAVARNAIRKIGYTSDCGFDADSANVVISLDRQSSDIAMGVDSASDAEGQTGAGDQGIIFGYASNETKLMMPMAIYLAHKLTRQLAYVRRKGILKYLRPDGKSQVTVEYVDGKPVRVDSVVISSQHTDTVPIEILRSDIKEYVINEIIPAELMDDNTKIYINPTGRFVIGGPVGDSGLTGRKIIVDTYGGYARHGGGAMSGKDPTKVDRSAAYMARYAAKNVVAAGLASKCELQIGYAIGVAHPVSVFVDTFGTGAVSDEKLAEAVEKVFDFTPDGIISTLDLRRPIYTPLAAYGHMGRGDIVLPWERTDKTDALKEMLGIC